MGVQDDLQLAVLVAVQRDGVLSVRAILADWPLLDSRDVQAAVTDLIRDGAVEVDTASEQRRLPMRLTETGAARLAGPAVDEVSAWLGPGV